MEIQIKDQKKQATDKEKELELLIKDLLYNKKYTIQGARRHLKSQEKNQKYQSTTLDEIRLELEKIRNLLTE